MQREVLPIVILSAMYSEFRRASAQALPPLWRSVLAQIGSTADHLVAKSNHNNRVIRIFISSTFKDFFNEREALVRRVFPALRDLCDSLGLNLVEVDLRWGVPEDASGEEAILTCMKEIERTQEAGMSFFLGLVGERYGWVPGEEDMSAELAAQFNWIPRASVTLMEMLLGAFRPNAEDAVFAVRKSDFLSSLPPPHNSVFESESQEASTMLSLLRGHLLGQQRYTAFEYPCSYAGLTKDPISDKEIVKLEGLDEFCDQVFEFFKSRITHRAEVIAKAGSVSVGPDAHRSLLLALSRFMVGREALVTSVLNAVTSGPVVALVGPAGAGKSTVMAQVVAKLEEDQHTEVFFHFGGAAVDSASEENLLDRLLQFLSAALTPEAAEASTAEPRDQITALLASWPSDRPLVIVFDALDELTPMKSTGLDFSWFPALPHLHLLVSHLTEGNAAQRARAAVSALPNVAVKDVTSLELQDARSLALHFFQTFGKRLSALQEGALMAHENSANPLWLTQACEELRIHGNYSTLSKVIEELPDNLESLNNFILIRIVNADTSGLLQDFLRLLIVAREGIAESEARAMLGNFEAQDEAHALLPAARWSHALHRLRPFVLLAPDSAGSVVRFKHRVVRASLTALVFPQPEAMCTWHLRAADHFQKRSRTAQRRARELPYHLFFAGARARLIAWLRSSDSFHSAVNVFKRRSIVQNYRCFNGVVRGGNSGKEDTPRMCNFCSNKTGVLSPFTLARDTCLICGAWATQNFKPAQLCHIHRNQRMTKRNMCFLCDKFCQPNSPPVRICHQCSFGPKSCSVIVTENDMAFRRGQLPWLQPMIPSVQW